MISQQWTKMRASASTFVSAITPKDSVDPVVWRWDMGIPQSIAKSENIVPTAPVEAIAAFVPEANLGAIRLVSTAEQSPVPVSAINDTRVHTLADLHSGLIEAVERPKKELPTIEFSPDGVSRPAVVSTNNLIALTHALIPDRMPIRVVEDGNPWVVLRDGAVRCKTMLRTERQSSLVHVIVSLKVCWGETKTLPVDLHLSRGSTELSCLTVPQILERMYVDQEKDHPGKTQAKTAAQLFLQIASQDEYLIPSNYPDLESQVARRSRLANYYPSSAFAVVGGQDYPGPALLGDARALSSFLLQPRSYSANQPEEVGWVVFDGRTHTRSENEDFELSIDLGSGQQKVQFRCPNSSM